ncbi:MAG: hypothetical protein FJW31_14000 [Acidobacteria bacterium]|nr:hypothetical protein [Acidobacteriota bacterium]
MQVLSHYGAGRPSIAESVCVVLLLLAMGVVLVQLARETGVTVDEPSHVLSAHLYWQGRDTLEPGDMPPLIKIMGGWVPGRLGLRLPPSDHPAWDSNHEWHVSLQMMYSLGREEIRRIFFWTRLPLIAFPLATAALLWWWARQLFSPAGGLLVAAVFALSPNVLGHGALFKNDLAATFGHLAFWYAAWRYWRSPSLTRAAAWGGALLLALLAKFSLLILAPLAGIILLMRASTPGRPSFATSLKSALLAGCIVYAGVIAAWQGSVGRPSESDLAGWRQNRAVPGWVSLPVSAAASLLPAPPRLWQGAMSLVQSNGETGPVYLFGRLHERGHPLYFAVALAVKLPIAAQIFILSGIAMFLWSLWRQRTELHDLLWAGPGLLYLLLASLSNLQLGVRLVLPALPFFFLFAGQWPKLTSRWRAAALAPVLLLGWMAWRAAATYPHYLSFFNSWIGGPENGLQVLSDSNIDWGQDIPRLARYVEEQNIPHIRLAYFGTDNPYAYLTDARLETIAPPWNEALAQGERFLPQPGYYAVSATLLTGQYFAPKYRDYYEAFREMKPVAKAGYSIFIYRVP